MATTRKSVPLTAADERGLERLRVDVVWRECALEIAGISLSERPSEAEALHALVEVGRTVLEERARERAMEDGYTALAQAQTDEDRAVARAAGLRALARLSVEE